MESKICFSRSYYQCGKSLAEICGWDTQVTSVNPAHSWLLAFETVAALLRTGVPTLVCCSCGLSRSVCIAAAGIAVAESRTLDESLSAVVGSGPADVSPGLLGQLRDTLSWVQSETEAVMSSPESIAPTPVPVQKWTVYRQDDNGNRFVVLTRLSWDEAERLVSDFEARGHKQVYWAEPELS